MITIRETEKARLLEHDGIQFWIQKRWQKKDGKLTPSGKQAMAVAADYHYRHAGFDATKAFMVERWTERAVLLSCEVKVPNESCNVQARFWIPRSMINDYRFVSQKVREVESGFPFIGTKVIWPKPE
jgi:hypothetical protein